MPRVYPKTCAFCNANYLALRSTGKFCRALCKTRNEIARYRAKYGVTRPALIFRRNKKLGLCQCGRTNSIGFQSCTKCRDARTARWQTYSPEERARRAKRKHPQSRKGKVYSEKERLESILRKREWYRKNKEKVIQDSKLWGQANKDKIRAKSARRRARKLGALGSHTIAEWELILNLFGYRCAYCKNPKNITKDHIAPLSKGGTDYAMNLQPLCLSCNSRKNNKPHKHFAVHISRPPTTSA